MRDIGDTVRTEGRGHKGRPEERLLCDYVQRQHAVRRKSVEQRILIILG